MGHTSVGVSDASADGMIRDSVFMLVPINDATMASSESQITFKIKLANILIVGSMKNVVCPLVFTDLTNHTNKNLVRPLPGFILLDMMIQSELVKDNMGGIRGDSLPMCIFGTIHIVVGLNPSNIVFTIMAPPIRNEADVRLAITRMRRVIVYAGGETKIGKMDKVGGRPQLGRSGFFIFAFCFI